MSHDYERFVIMIELAVCIGTACPQHGFRRIEYESNEIIQVWNTRF
jgi:hypothetical protein